MQRAHAGKLDEGGTMEDATFDQAKRVALLVACDPELNGIVYLAGGLVPWLLVGEDSGRLHGDVDVAVEKGDLECVRAWAQRNGFWRKEGDSRLLACNKDGADYGFEALVEGVRVSVTPFATTDDGGIEQRSFSLVATAGFDALLTGTMANIVPDDYVCRRVLPGGEEVGIETPEVVRAAKEASGRDKDGLDLRALASVGCDEARYQRVKEPVETMRMTFTVDGDTFTSDDMAGGANAPKASAVEPFDGMACCGTVCGDCPYFPEQCPGCLAVEGRVFWTRFTGDERCAIYACCVRERGLEHCGHCAELPCTRYDTEDPTLSSEENAANLQAQLDRLRALDHTT